MIIDSHCHAWAHWPYEPPVPDPLSRGSIAQLLFEMDQNGVDRAVIICAAIAHNPNNTAYVVDAARSLGSPLHDPFMAMSFMALEVIPSLKLTNRGLVDVENFRLTDLFA